MKTIQDARAAGVCKAPAVISSCHGMRCSTCTWEASYQAKLPPAAWDGSPPNPPEAVDHPPHYGGEGNPYEVIKVIEAWSLGFCLGNTVKYIGRAGRKGSTIEDLRKARWYLDREIQRMEGDGP